MTLVSPINGSCHPTTANTPFRQTCHGEHPNIYHQKELLKTYMMKDWVIFGEWIFRSRLLKSKYQLCWYCLFDWNRSLGITMYEIVVGRTPFEKDESEGMCNLPYDSPFRHRSMSNFTDFFAACHLSRILDQRVSSVSYSRIIQFKVWYWLSPPLSSSALEEYYKRTVAGTLLGSFRLSLAFEDLIRQMVEPSTSIRMPTCAKGLKHPFFVARPPSFVGTKCKSFLWSENDAQEGLLGNQFRQHDPLHNTRLKKVSLMYLLSDPVLKAREQKKLSLKRH